MSPYGSYALETVLTLLAVSALAFVLLYGARRAGMGRPTGGIDLEKAPEYLRLPNVPCVGGSWMLQKAALAAGDYFAVEALSRDAAELKRAAA